MHLAQIRNYSVNMIVRCRGLFFSILYTCCCLNIEIHSFLNSLLLIKIHSNGLQHWQAQRGNYSVKLMSISMSISMWTCGNFTFSIKPFNGIHGIGRRDIVVWIGPISPQYSQTPLEDYFLEIFWEHFFGENLHWIEISPQYSQTWMPLEDSFSDT